MVAFGSLLLTSLLTVAVTRQPPAPHLRSALPWRLNWMLLSTAFANCLVSVSSSWKSFLKSSCVSCGKSMVPRLEPARVTYRAGERDRPDREGSPDGSDGIPDGSVGIGGSEGRVGRPLVEDAFGAMRSTR